MNDGLSDDIKKKSMLSLTIELHDPMKKKCFLTPQSPLLKQYALSKSFSCLLVRFQSLHKAAVDILIALKNVIPKYLEPLLAQVRLAVSKSWFFSRPNVGFSKTQYQAHLILKYDCKLLSFATNRLSFADDLVHSNFKCSLYALI